MRDWSCVDDVVCFFTRYGKLGGRSCSELCVVEGNMVYVTNYIIWVKVGFFSVIVTGELGLFEKSE